MINEYSVSGNIAFNPLPTVTSRCSKLTLDIKLARKTFIVGGIIKGSIELYSTSSKISLGDIKIDLRAFEETLDKATGVSSTFLAQTCTIQGRNFSASSLSRGSCGYYQTKGSQSYNFEFQLPHDTPCTYTFQNIAKLRYNLHAVVKYRYKLQDDVLLKTTECKIVDPCGSRYTLLPLPVKMINQKFMNWWGVADQFVSMEVSLSQNSFATNTNFTLEVAANNNSDRKVFYC